MQAFMNPGSVALIGITRKKGPGNFNLMETMLTFGFSGNIYPVNPHAAEILGRRAYANVTDIKAEIDLAVISTPRETTLEILKDCATARIKAVIVVNQGFTDADEQGKTLQHEMSLFARQNGIRILGPNTLGVINCFNNFTTSFMPISTQRSPVGLICQSGIHFVGPQQFSGLFGKGIDLGNACDIGFYDALKYYATDPEIKLIAAHMEGLRNGNDVIALAREVAQSKPLIIHKSGRSKIGALAAMSHTGSMAGNYRVAKGAFKQSGVTFLEDGGDMPYAVKTLLNLPLMKGNRVAVLTYSGGAGIMVSDGLERYGLRLARLSPETYKNVARLSPDWLPLSNPLDLWPAVMLHSAREAYTAALQGVLKDPHVDAVICIAIAPNLEHDFLDVSIRLNEILGAAPFRKPVIAWTYGPNAEHIRRQFESQKQIMTYPTLKLAAWALSLLHDRYRTINRS